MTQRSSVAITNAYVVPVAAEPIENGTVVIEDGVISAVGTDVAIPDGIETIDAEGKWLLPGFVEGHGHIGTHEEGEGWAGDDTNEMTDPDGALDGDVVIWSGDPLDTDHRAERVFITGTEVYTWDSEADAGRGGGRTRERVTRFGI